MLKKISIVLLTVACSLLIPQSVSATIDSLNNRVTSSVNLSFSGKASIEEGQLRHSYSLTDYALQSTQMTPVWLNRPILQLRIDAFISNKFHIIAAPEIRMWGNTYSVLYENNIRGRTPKQFASPSIAEAEGIYTICGNEQNPLFQAAAGVFKFKYNNDAYNLGEYLFRSGCYTPYIFTTFDRAYATLTGFRFSSVLLNNNLRQDLLLTSETSVMPLYDWSLSYLVNYKVPSLLDIGFGISFNRLIPTVTNITDPKTEPGDRYLDKNGDTASYTFQGTKLMGKISFDPKGLLPEDISSFCGKEDGKIFAEVAVLGLKNYDAYSKDTAGHYISNDTNNYYKNISERIPVMFGINIPTFKVLDVLSVQGEWYNWKFGNSLFSKTQNKTKILPLPSPINITDYKTSYKNMPWSWSVYAKKNITNHIAAIGQIAHDHTFNEYGYDALYGPIQVFNTKDGWGWLLKLEYAF